MAGLCIQRLTLGKVEEKNPCAKPGDAVWFSSKSRGGPGEERQGAAGWSALTCYWGVRQWCVSRELQPYYPLIRRSGGPEGKMWRPEGNEQDQAKIPRERGWGQRDAGEEKKERSGEASKQLHSPGLHINEQGCPLWAKRGKSLLSMDLANTVSVQGVCCYFF